MALKGLPVYFLKLLSAIAACASLVCLAGTAGAELRVGVLQFERGAVSAAQADLITDLLAREIAVSEAFSVDSGAGISKPVGVEEAVRVGAGSGWDYAVLWSLKDVGELGLMGLPEVTGTKLSIMASATLDVRLIDVRAAETRAGLSETGSASPAVSPLAVPRREAMESAFGEMSARAVVSAVSLAGRAIRGLAGHEDLLVSGVNGEEYAVSIGTDSGAKAGALYVAFSDWPWEKIPVALLRLRDAGPVSGICVIARSPGAAVMPGDRLEAISSEAAKEIELASYREPPTEKAVSRDDAVSSDVASSDLDDAVPADAASNDLDDPSSSDAASGDQRDLIEALSEMAESRGALIVTGEISSGDQPLSHAVSPDARADLLASWARSQTPDAAEAPVEPPDAAASVTRADAADGDNSTGIDVIETYPLSPMDRSNLRTRHTDGRNLYERGRYAESFAIFKQLAESYRGNYLSAYWAGMAALKLGRKKDALDCFERALAINPNYRPALSALETQGQ
ncbi:MAG: tetratricopeptide repeat protein [Synergistaceae bacterium]|jgi:hypothetical protein|nr:tetratricopeptide repeat protein [Synergistaceae bacterium]